MKKTLLFLAATSFLAACSSTPTENTTTSNNAQKTAPATVAEAAPLVKAPVTESMYPAKGVGGALGQRTIHYAFDKYTVTDEFMPVVSAHGDFLLSHAGSKIVLQGNCDERGSREYNLGLGQRRADSVRKVLLAKGVKDGQIETVSFGKEKPVNPEHNKAAWAENRRTDIVYQGE